VKQGLGLGAGLEARFRARLHWGAEFLADKVRLCALGDRGGKPTVFHTFEGGYREAEAFAVTHGLAYEGLQSAISHLPFKMDATTVSERTEEDILPEIERIKPQGLPSEAFDVNPFRVGENRYLILAREDALKDFLTKLPESISSLWCLEASPLALLPFLDPKCASGHWAALLSDSEETHVLFFREESILAYAKVFVGWEAARLKPASFTTELKKALVYHIGSRFPGLSLGAIQIWRDGFGGEIASALKGLNIPQVRPDWGELAAIPEPFRVSGAKALQALRSQAPLAPFSTPTPEAAESRRAWRRRTGVLARFGTLTLAGMAIGVLLLSASALALRWTVEAKAKDWSGELHRWSELQAQRAEVEARLNGVKRLLARRTDCYVGMQSITALLPPELWLETWELEKAGERRFNHRLEGYSLAEVRVPEFLANLEKSGRLGSVKLKSTERIKGEIVEAKTHIQANRKDLIRFQIGVAE
jgi:Tfp pilus assembly protein PilN